MQTLIGILSLWWAIGLLIGVASAIDDNMFDSKIGNIIGTILMIPVMITLSPFILVDYLNEHIKNKKLLSGNYKYNPVGKIVKIKGDIK